MLTSTLYNLSDLTKIEIGDKMRISYSWPKTGDVIKWTTSQGEVKLSLVLDNYPDISAPDGEPLKYSTALPSSCHYQSFPTTVPSEPLRVMTGDSIHLLWCRAEDVWTIGKIASHNVDG